MDDLPELPFLKVLSYLSLEDRLKFRAVSRSWYHKIANSRVKSLCFSQLPIARIRGKSWVSGALAQNFISSTRFATFVDTYGHSILVNLKRLHLCDLELRDVNGTLAQTLNSFGQLEELAIIRFKRSGCPIDELELNLPMLKSFQFVLVGGIEKLTLDAPKLKKAKFWNCGLRFGLVIVHGESVERLHIGNTQPIEVNNLKNLQYLCIERSEIDPKFSSCLQHLKELHLKDRLAVSQAFDLRHGRTDLKIYFNGFLLNGPDDPAINSLDIPDGNVHDARFIHLAENLSRLADEIPFCELIRYRDIQAVAPESAISVLKRFTDFSIIVFDRVQDIDRFLDLTNLENLMAMVFFFDQPQELFDRLPEHCAVRNLFIRNASLDFLSKLKHLSQLVVQNSMDIESIRNILEQYPFLQEFSCLHRGNGVSIRISSNPKRFSVSIAAKEANVSDVDADAAIQFILENCK